MIALRSVSKKFYKEVVLDNVNLTISKCGVYLLRGNSGCGKSTLLNIISKISRCEGQVINDHLDNMSYVFQNSYLIEHLNVKENLDLYKIDYLKLKRYGIYDKLYESVASLSTGEKSRVAFIIGLYSNSDLLLLDEPIANLDKRNAKIVIEDIFKFKKEKIIIIVSHEYKEFIKRVDGIINIKNNRVIFKDKSKNKDLRKSKNKIINLDKNYIKKEFDFYKKENIKKYMLIFAIGMLIFLSTIISDMFLKLINRDISFSADYNKYYLSECSKENYGEIVLKSCSNPSIDNLNYMDDNGVEYLFNYDLLLNDLYKREDLAVINDESVILKEGRYPLSINEVIVSDNNYSINDKIILEPNLIVTDIKNDIYKKRLEVVVVGISNDLIFLNDKNIYFDYKFVDNYFKNEMLINNNYSLYEYYSSLDITNYKYLTFTPFFLKGVSFENNKVEFYSSLINVYEEVNKVVILLNEILIFYSLYLVFKLTHNKLKESKRSNAFLISNSFSVIKSVWISSVIDIGVISVFFIVLMIVLSLFNANITFLFILLILINLMIFIMTYFYYRKINVSNLMRLEV